MTTTQIEKLTRVAREAFGGHEVGVVVHDGVVYLDRLQSDGRRALMAGGILGLPREGVRHLTAAIRRVAESK